ncbi:MAG: hypothetical protein [Olavius algarvensis Gamma 3 endosymbiont]|nr:MAG: hypothetical protein [Olavius algarvensis Gamma 3 endosymbiont]
MRPTDIATTRHRFGSDATPGRIRGAGDGFYLINRGNISDLLPAPGVADR